MPHRSKRFTALRLAMGLICAPAVAGTMEVDLQLSPPFTMGTVTRCICFTATDCCGDVFAPCVDVTFTGGVAIGVTFESPEGAYECLEAKDPLHTLRAIAPLIVNGDDAFASLVGDPDAGGNWLISGNLNDDFVIDILDIGVVFDLVRDGVMGYPSGDTVCGTPGPHIDINGDAIVDLMDYDIVAEINFLAERKRGCCADIPPTDTDGDGTIDYCDDCPDDPDKTDPGFCGCGFIDGDSDGDGIVDCLDECPGVDDGIFAPGCVGQVPAVSTWGMVVLALGLMVGAKLRFGHVRRSCGA